MTKLTPRISLCLACQASAYVLAVVFALAGSLAPAQSLALADAAVARQLETRVTLAWRDQTLGAALARLVETQGTPLWIDRRVDTSAVVELSVRDEPVRSVFDRLAARQKLAVTPFRSLVYFGPRQTADELATLSIRARDSLTKAPAAVRAKWLQEIGWSFPRLSEPGALVEGLARSVGATVSDEQRVPMDLWPAQTLPALSVLDRIVLILAGFDLTAEISPDGRRLRVTPIERPVEITRGYSAPRDRQAEFDALLSSLPPGNVKRRGARSEVAARWEVHEQLRAAIRGGLVGEPPSQQSPKPRRGAQRFTLKIANQPVDRVIDQIARQTGLSVEWSSPPPQGPAGLVSCDVRDVDVDELLQAILAPAGLTAVRDADTVSIRPAS